jgi:type I restriction-modification system DNA methylase subunit
MLLSAAATFPRWAIDMGLVQFYGIDIDPTCVQMCKINLMLHGMNSYFVKCANALTEPFVVAMRATSPALNEAYSSAENMTSDEKHELSFAIRNGQYSFFELPVAKEMVEGIV